VPVGAAEPRPSAPDSAPRCPTGAEAGRYEQDGPGQV